MLGFVTWLVAGVAAFALGRVLRPGRDHRLWLELMLALAGAAIAGMVATALDFGGWAEADPRAFLFVFFVTLALLGVKRAWATRVHS